MSTTLLDKYRRGCQRQAAVIASLRKRLARAQRRERNAKQMLAMYRAAVWWVERRKVTA